MPEGHSTVSCKCPTQGDVPVALRALRGPAGRFALDLLIFTDEDHWRISGSDGAPGSASDAVGGDLGDDKRTPYSHDNDGDDWEFFDLIVDSLFDVRAGLLRNFEAICKLGHSARGAVPDEAFGVYSLGLQNPNAIIERDSAGLP